MSESWTPEYRSILEDYAADRIAEAWSVCRGSRTLMKVFWSSMGLSECPKMPLGDVTEVERSVYRLIADVFCEESPDVRLVISKLMQESRRIIDRPNLHVLLSELADIRKT